MRSHGVAVQIDLSDLAGDYREPTTGAAGEHYPELADDAPPPLRLDDSIDDSAPDSPRQVEALAVALRAVPLDVHVRERMETWLRSGEDPPLEEALAALGDNPMQVAFALLMGQAP